MATIKKFENLEIWQEARGLSNEIKEIVFNSEFKNDFRWRDQIKGSSGSIMDNIAEGFKRDGNIEFRQFLSIAKGPAGASRSHFWRVFDTGYITEEKFEKLVNEYEQLSKRNTNFIISLNKQDFKGNKFR